jgi:hypothetical protein
MCMLGCHVIKIIKSSLIQFNTQLVVREHTTSCENLKKFNIILNTNCYNCYNCYTY